MKAGRKQADAGRALTGATKFSQKSEGATNSETGGYSKLSRWIASASAPAGRSGFGVQERAEAVSERSESVRERSEAVKERSEAVRERSASGSGPKPCVVPRKIAVRIWRSIRLMEDVSVAL